jgi:glycosyltransferase involved in cell wall biosynthesis
MTIVAQSTHGTSITVEPVPTDIPRPFWSVMMPTYRPEEGYLRQALESVLQQAPGPEQMQIEVVDDCSPGMDVAALVKSIAGDRVQFSRTPQNLGLAGGWNTCIERSRGEWVHIMHQDDLVLPGFYERLGSLIKMAPEAGMICSRHAIVDGQGHWQYLGQLEQSHPGLLHNWLERVVTGNHLVCPAVIVKRSVYEHLDRFNPELYYALDLEMWIRIAVHYPVAYEPAILACYRRHADSETNRLEEWGGNMLDMAKALKLCRDYLPPDSSRRLVSKGQEFWAGITLELAEQANAADKLDACARQLQAVRVLCNRGSFRKRRIKLGTRIALKRALGPRLLVTIRRLRSAR